MRKANSSRLKMDGNHKPVRLWSEPNYHKASKSKYPQHHAVSAEYPKKLERIR